MDWVAQEDPAGCGAATLAMLAGCTYEEAKSQVDEMLWDYDGVCEPKPVNWNEGGMTQYHLDRALYAHGFFKQTRYASWGWDLSLPFAPLHWAIVQQPSNNFHFVAVDHDGTAFDPMQCEPRRLSDWPKVVQLCGLVKP